MPVVTQEKIMAIISGPVQHLCERPLPAAVRTKETKIFQFADDTAVVAIGCNKKSALRKAEAAIAQLGRYFVNEEKTEAMTMGKKKPKQESIKVGETRVKLRRRVQYLGVVMEREEQLFEHVRGRGGQGQGTSEESEPDAKRG